MFTLFASIRSTPQALVVFVLLLLMSVTLPKMAAAQVKVIDSGVNSNTSQIARINSQIFGLIQQLVTKEYQLDPRQQAITNQAAARIYAETKAYIASGNNGRPFYLNQNLEVYRAEIEAALGENFVNELQQSTMCDAFKAEVIAALKQRFIEENARNAAERSSCALTESDNIQSYMAGEWSRSTFHTQTIADPENAAPLPALWQAETNLETQIREQQEIEEKYLDWGDGFLNQYEQAQANGGPVMVCSDPRQRFSTETNGIRTHECRIATPSTIMRERMASLLNIEVALKTNGDEHQETQAQVVDALIRPTMTGGITGRAQSTIPNVTVPPLNPNPNPNPNPPSTCSGTANNPFCAFPQVPNSPTSTTTQQFLAQVASLIQQTAGSSTNPIREHLVRTMTALQYHLETITMTNNIEQQVQTATTQYAGCYNLSLPNSLYNNRVVSGDAAPDVIEALKGLTDLFLRYRQAQSAGQPTTAVEAQYEQFRQSAIAAPTATDLQAIADVFNANVEDEFQPFQQQHNARVAACAGA